MGSGKKCREFAEINDPDQVARMFDLAVKRRIGFSPNGPNAAVGPSRDLADPINGKSDRSIGIRKL